MNKEKDCRDCRYFVGCECFSGLTCDTFTPLIVKPTTKKEKIINDLKTTSLNQSEIARKYGVSRQYVSTISIELWGRK
jgi:hypothetical protein